MKKEEDVEKRERDQCACQQKHRFCSIRKHKEIQKKGSKNAEGGQRAKNATFVKSLHYKNDRNFRGARNPKKGSMRG